MSRSKSSPFPDADTAEPDFISRWSRLKHEAKRPAGPADSTDVNNRDVATDADRLLTDADMPDIDSLTFDSVYADFLSPGVSEKLRKLALRKLFHSEAFTIRDGLDEYDGDYTEFEKLGDTVTSDMRHRMEMEARRKAQQLLEDDQCTDAAQTDDHAHNDSRQASIELCADSVDEHVPQQQNERQNPAEATDVSGEDGPGRQAAVTHRGNDNG